MKNPTILLRCKLCKKFKFSHDDDFEKVVDKITLHYFARKVKNGRFQLVKTVCPACNPEAYVK